MTFRRSFLCAIWASTCLLISHADTLELVDGKLLQGTYSGGTAGTVRFESAGRVDVFPIRSVLALTISRSAQAAQTPTPAPSPAQNNQPSSTHAPRHEAHVIPAGSDVVASLKSELSTSSARSGDKFEAILQSPLRVGSIVIAPKGSLLRGTVIHVRKPRRVVKTAELSFILDEAIVGSSSIRFSTHPKKLATKPDGSIVRGAVAGAIIGEAVDDDAGHGAVAGASLGALKRGDDIAIPAGAIVSLKLAAPISVSP